MTLRRLVGLLAAVGLLLAVALLLAWPGPGARGSLGARAPSRGAAVARGEAPGGLRSGGGADPTGSAEEPSAGAGAGGAPGGETAEAQVDRNVREFLGALAPELDLAALERTCTPDGLHCTFTGPWPADDLLVRWIRAQGSGDLLREELEGVTFSRFRREQDPDGRPILLLQAHAPGANPSAAGDAEEQDPEDL